ncbi:hypothetical protein CEV32_2869 [Brucella rhizosphaerae]|uniref:Uncharacterized protein n=1 Tax=Brucella rhizosphaerae TaxID=571254 RepID=A0A256EZY2_9HYPH|nr:hypothetical protein CEV32_2869 [Brucella rhizosphaerae]
MLRRLAGLYFAMPFKPFKAGSVFQNLLYLSVRAGNAILLKG